MDSSFIVLVALPLAIFLLVIVFYTVRSGESDDTSGAEGDHRTDAVPASELTPEPDTFAAPELAIADATAVLETIAAPETPAHVGSVSTDAPATAVVSPAAAAREADSIPAQQTPDSPSDAPNPPVDPVLAQDGAHAPEAAAPVELTAPEVAAASATVEPASSQPSPQAQAAPPGKPTPEPEPEPEDDQPILSGQPLILPSKGSPRFAFDYRGRLWVEKKNKGFFKQLRRPQLPPDEPQS